MLLESAGFEKRDRRHCFLPSEAVLVAHEDGGVRREDHANSQTVQSGPLNSFESLTEPGQHGAGAAVSFWSVEILSAAGAGWMESRLLQAL